MAKCCSVLSSIVLTMVNAIQLSAAERDYPIRPVPLTDVNVRGDFWAPRISKNRDVTVPYDFRKCEETGRIANFAVAGGLASGGFEGIFFNDSDVFKVIEGASYCLAEQSDAKLDQYLDDLITKIASAQEDDGYLYTARTIGDPKYEFPGRDARWSHLASGHELYNVGHLYEAAVAHWQATGKRSLLDVAIKNADLICRVFGPGDSQQIDVPGHQEIEIGLVKLYRVTGDEKYLSQANFFIDMRGRSGRRKTYGPYSQDHKPVVEQKEAVGHAVRAGYFYAGVADVAALSGNLSTVTAIPYYAWAHRKVGEMAVWVARDSKIARVQPMPTIASTSRASASHVGQADAVEAVNDQIEPGSSIDHDVPRHTWWDRRGTREWLQYDFAQPQTVNGN